MKLLFDQNLSLRLAVLLSSEFPDSRHVRQFGLSAADDTEVWRFAGTHGFLIVSKDVDFQQRSLLYGHPPKVIWLRVGNCSTARVAALLKASLSAIQEFESDPAASLLALS